MEEPKQQPARPCFGLRQLAISQIIGVKRSKDDSSGAAEDNPGNDDLAALARWNKSIMWRWRPEQTQLRVQAKAPQP
jgi:hypothetical protein